MSDTQRAALEVLSRSQTAAHREVRRARVLLLVTTSTDLGAAAGTGSNAGTVGNLLHGATGTTGTGPDGLGGTVGGLTSGVGNTVGHSIVNESKKGRVVAVSVGLALPLSGLAISRRRGAAGTRPSS